jgi:DNA polymerase-3 subunit epsilon
MEFAIIDIETTGSSPIEDRITEIAIVIHNGYEIKEKWTSLINPQRNIPYFITQLTGITNEMVALAPLFIEVIPQILELTENRIFVAHNVHFDYNFIKAEFQRYGAIFQCDKLCTVRLSRKIIPGFSSYSLDVLCNELEITVQNRHRALGDAEATAQLLSYLLSQDRQNIINDLISEFVKSSNLPPNLPLAVYKNLPEEPGVYYFLDKHKEPIYIGKSNNIKKRISQHFASGTATEKKLNIKNYIHDITYTLTGSDLVAQLLESEEIKFLKPKFNIAQKQTNFAYGLYLDIDSHGYYCLSIKKNNVETNPLRYFSSLKAAKSYLESVGKKYRLCQQKLNMHKTKGPCFWRQIYSCDGACIEAEKPEDYNLKVENIMNPKILEGSFLIIEQGLNSNEKALVLVVNGKYWGYAFVSSENIILNLENAKNLIPRKEDNQDVQNILHQYISKPNPKAKILYFKK